jgi:hypothetical protein
MISGVSKLSYSLCLSLYHFVWTSYHDPRVYYPSFFPFRVTCRRTSG